MSQKDERAASILQRSVGKFLSELSEPGVLVTITKLETFDRERTVNVYITIYPESREEEIMKKLRRERSALREHVREHEKLANLPVFDFLIDRGEKNRQHIDEISGKL